MDPVKSEEQPIEEESPDVIGRIGSDNPNLKANMTFAPEKKSNKKWFFVVILLVVVLAVGYFFRHQIKNLVPGGVTSKPSSFPVTQLPSSTPTPNPLIKSQWSFEVLNDSGATGLAKTIAAKVEALGYQVVKTGNADKSNYAQSEILVTKDLLEKVDLVIADLKDAIKIASVAGELKEGTASARIIIGKDAI